MAIDYTAWPTPSQVWDLLASANITPTLSSSSDLAQLKIDAAAQKLTQTTKRQFLAGDAGEVRYFDGTGTGILIVDEFIDISDIRLYTIPSYSTVNLLNTVQIDRNLFPKTRIQILQGPVNTPFGWFLSFPQGRSNVQITGTWGYGATIPADVWEAVLSEAAANVADANRAAKRGVLETIKDDDVTLSYSKEQIGSLTGWRGSFKSVCSRYRRPLRDVIDRGRKSLL